MLRFEIAALEPPTVDFESPRLATEDAKGQIVSLLKC
jgi:hypothetical protein